MEKIYFDDIFEYVGPFGAHQVMMFLLLGIVSFTTTETVNLNFVGYTPEHWCKVDELVSYPHDTQKTVSLPIERQAASGKIHYESCEVYDLNYSRYDMEDFISWNRSVQITNETTAIRCPSGWVYDRSVVLESATTKWDLVCSDAWMVPFLGTVSLFGKLLACLIVGPVSDRYGRWPGTLIFMIVKMAADFLSAFAPNYPTIVVARILMSVGGAASYLFSFTLLEEMVGPAYRTHVGMGFHSINSVGLAIIGPMAYFLRDDVSLQLLMAVISCTFLLAIWLIPESPRWLMLNGKTKAADKVLRKMAFINGRVLKEDFDVGHIQISRNKGSNASILDIFRSPILRKRFFILSLHWFTDSLIFIALSLNAAKLSGDIFLNTFLLGIVEIPANLSAIFLMNWKRVGRRGTACLSLLMAGLAAIICVPLLITEASPMTVTVLSLLGKAFAAMAFSSVYLYTSELFPTEVRSLGIGMCGFIARLSGMMAPFIGGPLGDVWLPLPSIIFGSFGVLSGLVALLLPETLGKNLTDTIQEVEDEQRSKDQNYRLREIGDDITEKGKDNHGFDTKL